ncbi:YgiT-type zinc finger protein [candidate division KSB1 bacterium]|nr:YgiT-type zinc finger protein [candidate division KSB1 bacterium]MBL7093024.1 YgiT-type zinc finger protein [candidate division KSB1 bacterium]
MKCIYCQADMQKRTAPYHIDRKGYHLFFKKVPAWVCSQCGEPYFEEIEVEEIQSTIKEIDKHVEKFLVAA